jgi:hypothetical protein
MSNKPNPKKPKRPTAYDKGQHELICQALKVSPDPDAPGDTAYEAVCVLLTKLGAARRFINHAARMLGHFTLRSKTDPLYAEARHLQRMMRKSTFRFLRLYGTGLAEQQLKDAFGHEVDQQVAKATVNELRKTRVGL